MRNPRIRECTYFHIKNPSLWNKKHEQLHSKPSIQQQQTRCIDTHPPLFIQIYIITFDIRYIYFNLLFLFSVVSGHICRTLPYMTFDSFWIYHGTKYFQLTVFKIINFIGYNLKLADGCMLFCALSADLVVGLTQTINLNEHKHSLLFSQYYTNEFNIESS